MKEIIFILFVITSALLFSPVIFAAVQDFTYDSPTYQVNMTYDQLNRILTKNSTITNITYAYDSQYEGTLSNVTFTNGSYTYEYDERMRLIREIRTIDGAQFEKRYYYDSMGRLVKQTLNPGNTTDYQYNNQSRISKILGFVNNSFYDAFDKILNRTYSNAKLTEFAYNSNTSRLGQIKTGANQDLNFYYDSVGNVISIDDRANSRIHNMTYDFLDRLTNGTIAGSIYIYTYNPIGNILKIVRDSLNVTKFVYGTNPVHAPSRIVTGEAGIELHKASELNSTNKTRFFDFYLANEKNSTLTNANWTIDFGNSLVNSNVEFNITTNESILFVIGHNFTSGGDYKLNFTAQSSGASIDFENVSARFGVSVSSLSITAQDTTNTSYRLVLRNDMDQAAQNVWWSCNNGQNADSQFTLAANEYLTVNRVYNYPSTGVKTLSCSVNSTDGNYTKDVTFEIKGIKIEDYNSTATRENNRLVQFKIKNYFSSSTISWNMTSDGQTFQDQITLGKNETTIITRDINYTTDGKKTVFVNITSGSMTDYLNESFVLKGLGIGYYEIHDLNRTNKILEFTINNYWPRNGTLSWNISDPSVLNTTVNLTKGESVIVYVENNYTTQGRKNLTISASSDTFSDRYSGNFIAKMTEIIRQLVLSESRTSTIVEIVAKNNVGQSLFSWLFNTGQENINSNQSTTLNNTEEVFILIETNYTTVGSYPINITINSTSYNDTAAGITIN